MLQQLRDFIVLKDLEVWYYLNTKWHNAFLDAVIPYFRNQFFWAPLYLFLLLFTVINFGWKGIAWCAGFLITFALSDQVSAHLIKPYVHRLRPCNNPYLQDIVHIIVPCGSGYSFPSSHAANHFALAVFMAVTLSKRVKYIWPIALFWAALVAYSQVYVGVHFPVDVTVGGIIGAVIGFITGKLFNWKLDFAKREMSNAKSKMLN